MAVKLNTKWETWVNQSLGQPITVQTSGTHNVSLNNTYWINLEDSDVTHTLPTLTLEDEGKILFQGICRTGEGTFFTQYEDDNNAIEGLGTLITADGRDSRLLQAVNLGTSSNPDMRYVGLDYSNLDQIAIFDVTSEGDDRGVNVEGELTVGKPNLPQELVSGEGDSYPLIHAFHYDESNRTGDTITGATDITTILKSDSGSTVNMFENLTSGSSLLIGGIPEHRFKGLKVKINTKGSITYGSGLDLGETDNYILETLATSGGGWVESTLMARQDVWPKTQTARQIASTNDNISEQWNFGFLADNLILTWNDVTLNINGTDYTTKWIKITLTDTITTSPILEQIKCHTDRVEVTNSGVERYGLARYSTRLESQVFTNTQRNPPNENIAIANGFTLQGVDNEFASGANDGKIAIAAATDGLDTSIPIVIRIGTYNKGTGTGDILWRFSIQRINDNYTMDGTAVPDSKDFLETISTSQDLVFRQFDIQIDGNNLLPGDKIMLGVDRFGTDLSDTCGANSVLVSVDFLGTFWE